MAYCIRNDMKTQRGHRVTMRMGDRVLQLQNKECQKLPATLAVKRKVQTRLKQGPANTLTLDI